MRVDSFEQIVDTRYAGYRNQVNMLQKFKYYIHYQ
jgi:hypothetical protein